MEDDVYVRYLILICLKHTAMIDCDETMIIIITMIVV